MTPSTPTGILPTMTAYRERLLAGEHAAPKPATTAAKTTAKKTTRTTTKKT